MDKGFFENKKVLIMGLGRFGGGADSAKFVYDCGANVTVTDLCEKNELSLAMEKIEILPVVLHLGGHIESDFAEAEIVIANPAVAPNNKFLQIAEKNGAFVTSQINIFFELCHSQIVGITGSNGKSTTTSLITHILKKCLEENVHIGGNIGNQPLLTKISQIKPNDIVVLELSSFQTEQLANIKKAPDVALLTNLTPNHLDRHGTFEDYCGAKENIFKYQRTKENVKPLSIFNGDDKVSCQWFEKYSKDGNRVCVKYAAQDVSQKIKRNYKLPGEANLSNLAAAIAVAKHFCITDGDIADAVGSFESLDYRLELAAEINGTKWYNDSISTTEESAIVALEAFDDPIIIAGGYDKGTEFQNLAKKIVEKAKVAILIGQTAKKIAAEIKKISSNENLVITADSMAKAVEIAESIAQKGDAVVLSPACASYDMFDNFQHRGTVFTELVKQIKPK